MYEIEKILRGPDSIKGYNKNKAPIYIISKKQLKRVCKRLRDRLASVESSTSTIEISYLISYLISGIISKGYKYISFLSTYTAPVAEWDM